MDKEMEERKIFLELSRLSYDSLKNRQAHEWRMSFTFWGIVGITLWLAVSHDIKLLSEPRCLILPGLVILSGAYAWAMWLIASANRLDKNFRIYFEGKALGESPKNPVSKNGIAKPFESRNRSYDWFVSQILFTAGLVALAAGILTAYKK